ncbi:MAG: preprotein translocase subunit SecA, partial [Rhodocyclaceae bacterium]|nr:preprotein translocase subunit SecA [Rhodocyclaceae bacterium]
MSRALALVAGEDIAPARPYAERAEREDPWHDRAAEFLLAQVRRSLPARLCGPARGIDRIADLTDRHDARLRAATDGELRDLARDMRRRLRREGFAAELVGECFALVREGAARALGKRHYPSQLMAGRALLDGRLVEMATGEGKTFAATLPACTMALAGYPVHVITVNDYLADRDGRAMAPLYEFFGLAVGTVVQGMAAAGRREAYAQPITYCSNKELAFDYLRDRALLGGRTSRLQLAVEQLGGVSTRHQGLVLRGLCYGLVDEADSVFIDEARTPLILSSVTRGRDDREDCRRALEFARALIAGQDYGLDLGERRARLADSGREKLDACAAGLDGVWASPRASEELVIQALSALHLFHRDQHYVVSEGKVQIVDESTGRVMPDRSWERGLHQMIEAKEGCELSERRDTLARITY